ncbi:hypothetical protein ES707_03889 [subsurface metagenome]
MNKKIGATLFILFVLLGQIVGIGFVKAENLQARENANNFLEDRNSSLHSASTEFIIPSVPHYYQTTNYYCGPASLEMIYDFYGPDISQLEIADVARADVFYGAYASDLRRATHFSKLSTSLGNDMGGNITGYTNRLIGYGAFGEHLLNVNSLVDLIEDGYPILVLQYYDESHYSGHFRVVIGYVRNGGISHLIVHDPWYSGYYSGPNVYIDYNTFVDLWTYFTNWALFICPWEITVSCPSLVLINSTFTMSANVEYIHPTDFSSAYSASSCQATIQLPLDFSLAPGEMYTKNLNPVNLTSGEIGTVTWQVVADVISNSGLISVNASGLVSGTAYAHPPEYPSGYNYNDLIGGNGSKLVKIVEKLPEDENMLPIIIITTAIIGAVVISIVVVLIVRKAKRKTPE